ncbi:MAG: GHKL domain-containing protein, partial [Lachnospiraceae bacterium]|nr:GHKL domain-containing protein [Lachnospiraceae bacterium]
RYYAREEEKYEESRKLIHDIRNHILAMEELYDSEKAEAAAHYAGDIHQMLNNLGQKYYTSEKLLNIILNDKVRQMQRAGIREDIKVGELSLDFMRDMDITALFANLLDNAIAAAAESREGFVKLRINNVRQFVSITLENSSDREPVKTKTDSARERKVMRA